MESKIRIPHVAKGTKAEECIMRAVKAKEEDGKRKLEFYNEVFDYIDDIGLDNEKSFNFILYKGLCDYFNDCFDTIPLNEGVILKYFSDAYCLATLLLNRPAPILAYNDYLYMQDCSLAEKIETEISHGINNPIRLSTNNISTAMAYSILIREPEKKPQMVSFLSYLKNQDEKRQIFKYFEPLDSGDEDKSNVEQLSTTQHDEEDEMETSSIKKERAKAAIKMLLEYSDSDYSLAKNKSLWWAVFRFFAEREFCPNNMAAFCRLMNEWGFQVSASNLKGPNSKMERLNELRTQNWKELVDTSTGAELKQIKVGMKLIEILRHLPKP